MKDKKIKSVVSNNVVRTLKITQCNVYIIRNLEKIILEICNMFFNDEVIKTPWFLYFDETKKIYQIYNGTTPEVLNMGIGHFEESPIFNGNISLAGHNRGYRTNPFEDLKDLKIGSNVIYKVNDKLYVYQIIEKEKIEETDFSKIERKGNFLTMITCIENQKEYRLCVTAKKILE